MKYSQLFNEYVDYLSHRYGGFAALAYVVIVYTLALFVGSVVVVSVILGIGKLLGVK